MADDLRAKRRAALQHLNGLTQAVFLEMFGDPAMNPEGWDSRSLTAVCRGHSGGTPTRDNDKYWGGTIPWFSPKDMKVLDLTDSQEHVTEAVEADTSIRLLPVGTVVVVVRGMILAHSFPVGVLGVPAFINQDMKALVPTVPMEPQFLATALRCLASFVLKQVSEAGHGTKRLDSDGLSRVPMIIPPVDLQREFSRRVTAINALTSSMKASAAGLSAAFSSLQHRAFAGEL